MLMYVFLDIYIYTKITYGGEGNEIPILQLLAECTALFWIW